MGWINDLVTVVVASALALLPTLKDNGYISNQTCLIYTYITLGVYVGQWLFLRFPRPVDLTVVQSRQKSAEYYLEAFLTQLNQPQANLGINIMLATRGRWWWETHLKIYYSAGRIYSDPERDLKWFKGQGTCGWAWKKNDCRGYGPTHQIPFSTLTPEQVSVVGSLCSVASFPLTSHGKVFGVLNLDSSGNIVEALYNDSHIRNEILKFVTVLEQSKVASFADGVKA